jgi:iron(III) transport system ATP-binding protein
MNMPVQVRSSQDAGAPAAPRGSSAVEAVDIRKAFGGSDVLRGVGVSAGPGRMLALLGPSGCGKTTLLRIIAGLEVPDAGVVRLGERIVESPDDGISVPPEKRRVGMVFQDWALFPHLTVARNVGFGLPRGERKRSPRIDEALEMVGLSGLGDRMPGTLSGGQQQRVALARALAPRPAVLLLDEPFSNLDTSLRVQVRSEVHELLARVGITTVFVTHDQDEAFVLGDEVAVMSEGLVVQQAVPADLYRAPATTWVAEFVGEANLVAGQGQGDHAATGLGVLPLDRTGRGDARLLVRPEHLRVDDVGAAGTRAEVELVEFYGHDTVYVLRLADGVPLRARVGSTPRFVRGDQVVVGYDGPPTVAYGADGRLLGPA